jgi:hypothetical protein
MFLGTIRTAGISQCRLLSRIISDEKSYSHHIGFVQLSERSTHQYCSLIERERLQGVPSKHQLLWIKRTDRRFNKLDHKCITI